MFEHSAGVTGNMRPHTDAYVQSTFLSAGEVTEDTVYTCTGAPRPEDIRQILNWMLNENFATAYSSMILAM